MSIVNFGCGIENSAAAVASGQQTRKKKKKKKKFQLILIDSDWSILVN
jgi:hypothetical protein